MPNDSAQAPLDTAWDNTSDQNFVDYYERESLKPETVQRFTTIRDKSLRLLAAQPAGTTGTLHVADIGCGTGTQSMLWAKLGHHPHGIDINAPLVEIARKRAAQAGMSIPFEVGSATELPYPDASMDVVLLPELLEHVADWKGCLGEAIRILKPGGLLYLSTTNYLCPVQEEFNLPCYSWYPGFLKRRYERLAVTTRPEIANYCRYPAVNWFSVYSLCACLKAYGFASYDRFDMIDQKRNSAIAKTVIGLIKTVPVLRFLGHVLSPGSTVFAIKTSLK